MAGTTKPTVYKWIAQYEQHGIDGLSNRVSTGRPPEISTEARARIVALTRQSPPDKTGLSHWSSREMARYLKQEMGISVSHNFVATLWREHNLQPHRQGTFKLSTDRDFEEKVIDVVGLYLDPPMDAVVLSIDEKTQVQALDRTQPLLPMTFSKTEKRTHDYTRHGTTNLFAALNTATGEVLGRCFPRRRTKEFLKFMDQVCATYADQQIHVVLDNLSTHSGSDVDKWLARHPNVTFHFTPTGSSWLNHVEMVQRHHQTSHQARNLHLTAPTHQHHQYLHHKLEPRLEALHLDRSSGRDHHQGPPASSGLQETTRQ
jgi:transposase